MTSHFRRGIAALGLAAGALLLVACAGSPATRYFTVTPVAAAARVAYAGVPIEVRGVQVPPALDRLEMVRDLAPGQLALLDFDHWVAPLGRLARQALSEDLAGRLPPDRVVIPGAAWPVERAVLTVDVLSFENRDGRARLVAGWALVGPLGASGAAPAPIGAALQLEVPAGGDASATAQAWSELLAQLADRIAAALPQGGAISRDNPRFP